MGNYCYVCGAYGAEGHHIVKRSQNKPLEHCPLNITYLCPEHHRGTKGVHGKKGRELDQELKLKFQNRLEIFFTRDKLTREEIKAVLEISDNSLDKLLKTCVRTKEGYYIREQVIRVCMGGKMVMESDDSNGL